jgi:hypothetical protein
MALACDKIIAKLEAEYDVDGLESLTEVDEDTISEMGGQLFEVILYSKDPTPEGVVAFIKGIISPNSIYIEELERTGFDQGMPATKGAGKLLAQLVACRGAELGISVDFMAVPRRTNNSRTKLYNFYNSIGFTRKGEEKRSNRYLNNGTIKTVYSQDYNTNAATLKSLFPIIVGGGGNNNNTLKVGNMSLTIVADGAEHDLKSLETLLASATPESIRVSKGDKHREFTLHAGTYYMSTPQIGPGLVRHDALINFNPDQVVGKIKSEFGLAGGRRRRRTRRRSSRRLRR